MTSLAMVLARLLCFPTARVRLSARLTSYLAVNVCTYSIQGTRVQDTGKKYDFSQKIKILLLINSKSRK
jgi:hypothetical protein